MNAVGSNGKKILAVALGVMMLAAAVPPATGQRANLNCTCGGKTLGRGGGSPVAVMVTMAGKPVAAAVVTVNTVHGVPVKSAKSGTAGVANTTLAPGDYIVLAKTKTASGMVQITVPKPTTTPAAAVSVTVTLTPNK